MEVVEKLEDAQGVRIGHAIEDALADTPRRTRCAPDTRCATSTRCASPASQAFAAPKLLSAPRAFGTIRARNQ
jgi:hypothetical protein